MDEPITTPDEDAPAGAPGFADLGLRPEILQTLDDLGYEEPTPIQQEAIPVMLSGRDMIGQAATGTGKTAAFALPALDGVTSPRAGAPEVLVLVPTRELAVQVSEAMFKYGRRLGVQVVPVFGGQPIGRQWSALERGAHVVVATPGRALDHIGRGALSLDAVRVVILDEADEMLDMGFADDIESILGSTPSTRQTVLFSATMPPRAAKIAAEHQTDPVRVQPHHIGPQAAQGTIHQKVYVVQRNHKPSALGRILDIETPGSTLVFCRTRTDVDQLTETMNGRGYRAEALHGGMDQAQRDRVMARLRDGTAELLVATDVAARGLDVDTLTHVVNYDVPAAAESYVHRIGRVGRAGREGTAITLAEPRQKRLLANIERHTGQSFTVERVPTVADLRERQVELTVEAVRESLAADDLDDYQKVLHALAGEDSERNLALAAIRLVHLERGALTDEPEIPVVELDRDRKDGKDRRRRSAGREGHRGQGRSDRRDGGSVRPDADRGTGFLYVNLGRKAGVRPGDLVGAIANESGLSGRQIGPIRIADTYSVVGVPDDQVERVIGSLQGARMRNKPFRVRRFVD